MKPDQERVRNLLMDTVGLLCRNGLSYRDTLKVEGLLGITLDNNEVFLVPIKQCFGEEPTVDPEPQSAEEEVPDPQPPPLKQAKVEPTTEEDTTSSEKKNVSIKAEKSDVQSSNDVNIKSEPADEDDDDDDLVITEAHVVERTPSLGKRKFRHLSSSNSLPRVPPLHGTPPPGAFPQLLKQFLDNSQNGSSGSDGGLGGGSPSMQWMTGETSGGMPNWRPEDTSGGNMDEQMVRTRWFDVYCYLSVNEMGSSQTPQILPVLGHWLIKDE